MWYGCVHAWVTGQAVTWVGAPCFNLLVTCDHLPRSCRGRTDVLLPANSYHNCCVKLVLNRVLCTHLGSKGCFRHRFCQFIDPMALPCWWTPNGWNSHPWLPLPTWYGCVHGWGTGQAVKWVSVCESLALSLHNFQGNFCLCNQIRFNLFFINYCNSLYF